jgi:hypothetical protein
MKQQRSPLEKRNALEKRKKRGCCGSTALGIVVARRSWREISLQKTQHLKNSLNFVSTCPKVVDTRRTRIGLDDPGIGSAASLFIRASRGFNFNPLMTRHII